MADKNQILSEINEVRSRYSERTVRYAINIVNECASDQGMERKAEVCYNISGGQ